MAIKAKSKRRLVILLVAISLLIGAGVGVFTFRQHQLHRETLESLEAGRAAMAEEDYFTAMHELGRYANRNPEDAEVLYEYSQARRKVESTKGQHLLQTVGVLRRVITMRPEHDDARHDLMELYVMLGYATETGDIADVLLKKDPNNAKALRAKAVAKGRLRKFKEALPIAERYNELEPLDLEGHILTLSLMRSLERPSQDIRDRAQTQHDLHPEDPRFELLMAIAFVDQADNETAIKWCRTAAARTPPDADFVSRLVAMLDKFHLYEESMDILKANASTMDNRYLFRSLIRRLSDGQQLNDLLDRLTDYELDENSDSEVLAIKALTLFRLKRPDEARPIVNFLAGREDDPTAAAWALVFDKVIDNTNTNVKEMIEVCRKALRRCPNHPYFHHYLARAYNVSGEHDLALEQWAKAVRRAPTWQAPITQAARSLMATGRSKMAMVFWNLLTHGRKNVDTVVTIAEIWASNLKPDDTEGADRLLRVVQVVQDRVPGEGRTLPIEVVLLARLGRTDEAREAIESAIAGETPPAEVTLLRLALASRIHKLGFEEACFDRIKELYGMSVNLAYNGAVKMANEGRVEEGLQWIESAAANSERQDDLPWRMARAQYLETYLDDRAKEAWESLADDVPDNRYVQQKALHARSTWTNREFVDRTIDRVRQLYGDDSPSWRVARARWLLQRDTEKPTLSEAVKLLKDAVRIAPTMVDARTLLADAYQKQGNLSAAVDELSVAEQLSPNSLTIAVIRASLLHQQGDFEGADRVLNSVLESPDATPTLRHSVARLLSEAGKVNQAIEILEAIYDVEVPGDLLLAKLYRKLGEFDKTEAICWKLLERPNATVIEFTADFLAYRGRQGEAEKVLAGLNELSLREGSREMILAAYHRRHGKVELSIENIRASVVAAPKRADARLAFISYLAAANKIDEAIEAVKTGVERFPDNETFRFLNGHIQQMNTAKASVAYRPLLTAMISNTQYRIAAVEVLSLMQKSVDADAESTAFLVELREMADRYPKFLPLQILTGRTYMAMSKWDEAISLATRTMQAFPNRIEPVWLTTEALASADRRDEAIIMAQKWRELAKERPMIPDLVIGELSIQLGRPTEALSQIEPYLDDAKANPQSGSAVMMLSARAMMALGRADEAAELLWPLTASSHSWRTSWMTLAIHSSADEKTTVQWLQRIEPRIPEDAPGEHLSLTQAWHTLGVRTGQAKYSAAGLKILEQFAGRPDAKATAVLTLALMQDSLRKTDEAEGSYRRVLEMEPHPVAMNNLSMIVAQRPDGLTEAVSLAQKAVKAAPDNAPFRDTLAHALAKTGDLDSSIENLEMAMRLDPQNVQWPANLAMLYLAHSRIEDARDTLRRIEEEYRLNEQVPPDVQKQIERLRDRVAQNQQPQAVTP